MVINGMMKKNAEEKGRNCYLRMVWKDLTNVEMRD